jgi:hypothetical protein
MLIMFFDSKASLVLGFNSCVDINTTKPAYKDQE